MPNASGSAAGRAWWSCARAGAGPPSATAPAANIITAAAAIIRMAALLVTSRCHYQRERFLPLPEGQTPSRGWRAATQSGPWLIGVQSKAAEASNMKRAMRLASGAALVLASCVAMRCFAQDAPKVPSARKASPAQRAQDSSKAPLTWVGWSDGVFEQARRENRFVLLD